MFHPEALECLLACIPDDVWARLWPQSSTLLLRCVSKSMRTAVDAKRLPAAVRMSELWWLTYTGPPSPAKWAVVLQGLLAVAARTNLSSIALLSGSRPPHGLITMLAACPKLQHFSISSNGNLRASGTEAVARALRPCTAITSLDLRGNDMGLTGVRTLEPRLAAFHALQHLDLGLNALHDSGVETLAPMLVPCTTLATLNITGNAMQAHGATALAVFVPHFSSLTHIDLGHNPIQNVGAFHLACALAHCPRLAHLDMSNTWCCSCVCACCPAPNRKQKLTRANRCTHFHALAELLHAFRALAHLDLSQNTLSQHGVQRLAAHIHTAAALSSLNLARCVQANYTHSLAAGLGQCTRLERLSLNFDCIGDFELPHYARHIQLCRLVRLDLRGNAVATGGAQVAHLKPWLCLQPCL